MKKRTGKLLCCLILICLMCACECTAFAIQEIGEVEGYGVIYREGSAAVVEKYGMSSDKPTLFFFGGIGERSSAKKTSELIQNIPTLNDWNVVSVALYRDEKDKPIRAWEDVAFSLCCYVAQRTSEGKMDPARIYIDGYSNGAAGALWSAMSLNGLKMNLRDGSIEYAGVRELTLIEGTLEGIIKPAQIESVLSQQINLTLYVAAECTYSLSAHGRKLVRQFDGRENFTGILVDHDHGSGIVPLVYTEPYNNHRDDF